MLDRNKPTHLKSLATRRVDVARNNSNWHLLGERDELKATDGKSAIR